MGDRNNSRGHSENATPAKLKNTEKDIEECFSITTTRNPLPLGGGSSRQ